jgi:hypothetical protein
MASHPVELVIDPAGNDNSGNGTVSNPFASLPRAIQELPQTGDCKITVNAGTYAPIISSSPIFFPYGPNSPTERALEIVGTFQTTTPAFAAMVPGSSRAVLTAGSPIFTTADIGRTVTCLTGANGGQKRNIRDLISPTQVRVELPWTSPLTNGDMFDIEVPASIIPISGPPVLLTSASPLFSSSWTGIKFDITGQLIFAMNAAFWGCVFEGNGSGTVRFQLANRTYAFAAPGAALATNAPFTNLWKNGPVFRNIFVPFSQCELVAQSGIFQNSVIQYTQANASSVHLNYLDCVTFIGQGANYFGVSPSISAEFKGDPLAVSTLFNGFAYPGMASLNIQEGGNAVLVNQNVSSTTANGLNVQDSGSSAALLGVGGNSPNGSGLWVFGGASVQACQNDGLGSSDTSITGAKEVVIGGRLDNTGTAVPGIVTDWATLGSTIDAQNNVGMIGSAGDRVSITSWVNYLD